MIEYSNVPVVPDAVTIIVPSFTPQFVGFVVATFEIAGETGVVIVTSALDTSQVTSVFLTRIW